MLKQLLDDYFTNNPDVGDIALHQDLKGWAPPVYVTDAKGRSVVKKDDNGNWVYGDYQPSDFENWCEESGNIQFDVVHHYGGEDQGSRYDTTYLFTRGDEEVYIQFYGWYASHVGSEYEDYRFVTPRTKVVIDYV